MDFFPETGKIQNEFFKSHVFPYCGKQRSDVIVGPQYGVDVALVNINNGLVMAMTSDPLSLIPTLGLRESAWLSVQLMANDMATTGFAPMYAQFTLNLPTTLSVEDFDTYWKHIHEFCDHLGIAITGGHTGRFEGLQSTVSGGGTMITIAPGEDIITSKGANPGDVLIMTKACALLPSAILAMSFPETVKHACGTFTYNQACELFYDTSAVEAGLAAGEFGRHTKSITAMHDITEGGVLGAVYELVHASDCGVRIDDQAIRVGDAQQKICSLFSIDPKRCIGAGAMLITVKDGNETTLQQRLKTKGIESAIIGRITKKSEGLFIQNKNEQHELTAPGADPYWEAFFTALKKGWK